MIDKRVKNLAAAVAGIKSGSTVLVAGFGSVGEPIELTEALIPLGVKDLIIVANNAGTGKTGIAALILAGLVRKVICSYPRTTDAHVFEAAYKAGKIELELVPQGTLSERM
ncbi:MAG: 3-oxoacid CoA-transferase subunit A, partial [Stellaceae bacterium]